MYQNAVSKVRTMDIDPRFAVGAGAFEKVRAAALRRGWVVTRTYTATWNPNGFEARGQGIWITAKTLKSMVAQINTNLANARDWAEAQAKHDRVQHRLGRSWGKAKHCDGCRGTARHNDDCPNG